MTALRTRRRHSENELGRKKSPIAATYVGFYFIIRFNRNLNGESDDLYVQVVAAAARIHHRRTAASTPVRVPLPCFYRVIIITIRKANLKFRLRRVRSNQSFIRENRFRSEPPLFSSIFINLVRPDAGDVLRRCLIISGARFVILCRRNAN